MKQLTTYLLLALLSSCLVSCMTERKAVKYFNEHDKAAADYCAVKFPVMEKVDIVIQEDTAGAKKIVDSLQHYADSLLQIAEQKNASLEGVNQFIDDMIKNSSQKDSALNAIRAQLAKVPRTDVNALRKSIEAELKAKVKPCKDSVITIVKENTAAKRAAEIRTEEEAKAHNKTAWWKDFWMYVAFFFAGVSVLLFFKSKIKFLKFLP